LSEVLVLCYHGISERWPAATSVTPGHLREHLDLLARRGYRGMTLSDALAAPEGRRTVVVTFDDAMSSVLELARPILEEFDMPGTVYVPTDYPGSGRLMAWDGFDGWLGTEHEHELRCMDWDDLRDLARGGWEIGSHTCSHPRLTRVDDATLAHELAESRRVCEEQMGTPCRSFAYPYSDEDDRVVRATLRAGYALAVTVPLGHVDPLPLRWPRLGLNHGEPASRLAARLLRRRHPVLDSGAGRALGLARRGAAVLRG
jgi:peptidoglycan/xylan/chitin deacetylase (PgdA/CDA1 family)